MMGAEVGVRVERRLHLKAGWIVAWGGCLILAAGLAGCGGDSGAGTQSLDQRLDALMADAGITPLDPGPVPAPAKVSLGRVLMFDKELSGNRDTACATCHHPRLLTGDALSLSIGTGGGSELGPPRTLGEGRNRIPRNAPEAFDRGAPEWRTMFWDMRVSGDAVAGFASPAHEALPAGLDNVVAAQAMFPVTARDEMRGAVGDRDVFGDENELAAFADSDLAGIWAALMNRLVAIPAYVELFAAAYPGVPSSDLGFQHAADAIAAFEIDAWTLTDSPWDRYLAGDGSAISDAAKRGAILFCGKAGCVGCHRGPLLTDQQAHDIGVPQIGPGKGAESPQDFGRGRETGEAADRYAFRTPPLRNVTLTGPWMHDGAYTSLAAAVRHHLDPASSLRTYDPSQLAPDLRDSFQGNEATIDAILGNLDPLVATPLSLGDGEVNDILTFLEALTDPAAADLNRDVPDSVPSGLPVDR